MPASAALSPARRLRSARLSAVVLPEAGAKISSLISSGSGKEWLWTDPHRDLSPRPATGDFAEHELSGWDECFPTIGACAYPEQPLAGTQLSDHGELWQRRWHDVSTSPAEIALQIQGQALPYRFARTMRVDTSGALALDYQVTNLSASSLRCLWSMHPLFAAAPGMRIHLPGRPALTKEFGFGGRLGAEDGSDGSSGRGGTYRWPIVQGRHGTSDLSLLDFPEPAVTDKVVARDLTRGLVELLDPAAGEALSLRFDPRAVPYCGVCVNMGAWPFADRPQRWIALEPSNGGTDRLDDACRRGEAMTVAPHATASWRIQVDVRPIHAEEVALIGTNIC